MKPLSPATRRHVLQAMAALAPLGAAAPLALELATMGAASAQVVGPTYRALVCIFLFGGNDTHNMVLATDTDSWGRYWAARNIGQDPIALMPVGTPPAAVGSVSPVTGRTVSRQTPEFFGGVLPITPITPNPIPPGTNAPARTFGVHPVMAPLFTDAGNPWAENRLAVLANVGPLIQPTTKAQYNARSVRLPFNLMSHNDQQSIWMASAAEGARRGWGGMMADAMLTGNGANAIFTAISTSGNAVFLAGDSVVQYQVTTNAAPAVRITSATGATLNGSSVAAARLRDIIREGGAGSLMMQDQAAVVRRSMDTTDRLNSAFTSTAVTAIPAPPAFTNPITGATEANQLGPQMQTVARLIAAAPSLGVTRQVFFVSLGGWDTHDVQNTAQPNLLAKVAQAMVYLDQVLGNIGGQNLRNAVTAFTMSDFSRTFTTNGDGTDHAWGAHQLVMGGAVRGRDMYGRYPTLGVDRAGFTNPDMSGNIQIPTTSVYQLASTLGRWFGVSDSQVATIFPNLSNFPTNNLGFMA